MRHIFLSLFDSKISHDFFRASINTGKLESPLETLQVAAHAVFGDCSSSENLTSLIRDELAGPGGLQFQKGNRTCQEIRLFGGSHTAHLVSYRLYPVLHRFYLTHHMSQFVTDYLIYTPLQVGLSVSCRKFRASSPTSNSLPISIGSFCSHLPKSSISHG